jgi:serine/threonine protein kinase
VLEIQEFDQRASEALIRSNNSIDFDRRAVELIRFLSGGNPYLINILGNEICKYLRDKERPYCFRDDVEEVVSGQLDAASSPIWLFLQYLLKKGEEDYASEIPELPALIDLAWTLGRRGSSRDKVAIKEIEAELRRMDIAVDSRVLADQIERAAASELLVQEGDRFRFESPWLGEWLTISNGGQPIPIESLIDPDLVLNRYHITKAIAHSGIAQVWLASDTQKSQGTVILKIYSSNGDMNSGVVQRESENLSRIKHPAVVGCLNCGRDDQRGDVVVLEYVTGETLERLIQNAAHHSSGLIGITGDLTTQVEFIEQITAGLADCHAVGVVHKDIKPSNIIAQCSAGKWYPKIIDFGISSEVSSLSEPTLSPYTPEYVSPEKLLNKPRKSPADIYSLGLVAYELLTGVSPFGDDLPEESRRKRLKADFIPLKEKRSDVSLRLSELVGRMLAVDPTVRPTADTLTGELSQARKDLDWLVLKSESLMAEDPEEICDNAFAALLAAPEAVRSSLGYFELADLFVAKAGKSRKTTRYARQILQPLLLMVRQPLADPTVLSSFVKNLLAEMPVDELAREDKRIALQTFVEFLLITNPCSELVSSLDVLLSNQNDPVIWNVRHELFLIAVSYTAAQLVSDRGESWCIRACKKMRPLEGGPLLETQLWLRRVEALSVSGGADYLTEKKEVERLLQAQAGSSSLPDAAKVQDPKIVDFATLNWPLSMV